MSDKPSMNLNVKQIADAVNIIDYAFEQGAFKGLETVRRIIDVRDHLFSFVSAVNASVTENQTNQSTPIISEPVIGQKKPRVRRHTT